MDHRKVIFLDVDGVLNSAASWQRGWEMGDPVVGMLS